MTINFSLSPLKPFYSTIAKIIFLTVITVIIMWHSLVSARSSNDYPNLSENLSASSNYEIVKLVDHSIAVVLYHEQSQQIIIDTGNHLGKINQEGQLVDFFKIRRSHYSSGLAFSKDDYNDWILTGQKENKAYDKKIDARGYSDEQLFELFNQAEIVEFSTNNRYERKGYAHLYNKGIATLVDISNKAEKIGTDCDTSDERWWDFRWKDICFQGYRPNKKLIILENMASWGRSSLTDKSDTQPPLTLMKFSREKYTLDEGVSGALMGMFLLPLMGYSSELPNAYWFGDAYFKLKHKDETLTFKMFADNEGEHINHRNLSIYQPESPLFDETKLIVVNYRFDQLVEKEAGLNKYYEQDVGLYVLRKKGLDASSVIKPSLIRWQPAYSGEASSKPIFMSYSFFDRQLGAGDSMLTKQGKSKEIFLRLPKTISLDWHTKKRRARFRLKISDSKTAVYQHSTAQTEVSFAVGFDEDELRRSFALISEQLQKNSSAEVIKLEVKFDKITKDSAQLKIGLASKKLFIELKNYSVSPIGNLELKKKFKASYKRALKDSTQLNAFFLQIKGLSKEPDYVDKYIARIAYYFAKLVNNYNGSGDFKASIKATAFYAEHVHPRIFLLENNKDSLYNNSVIASQTLVASIYAKDDNIQKIIFDKLLSKPFDINQSKNGTLAFNLACFYALSKDKNNMLIAIKRAKQLGKPKSQFMKDGDFKAYLQDEDFLRVISNEE